MSLNESIVEDAALEWFGELGYAIGHGPNIAPDEPWAVTAITQHLQHLFSDNELEETSVVKQYLTTATDGKTYDTGHGPHSAPSEHAERRLNP